MSFDRNLLLKIKSNDIEIFLYIIRMLTDPSAPTGEYGQFGSAWQVLLYSGGKWHLVRGRY
jgi:hypothetical protein